jgi:hypothetical protein
LNSTDQQPRRLFLSSGFVGIASFFLSNAIVVWPQSPLEEFLSRVKGKSSLKHYGEIASLKSEINTFFTELNQFDNQEEIGSYVRGRVRQELILGDTVTVNNFLVSKTEKMLIILSKTFVS